MVTGAIQNVKVPKHGILINRRRARAHFSVSEKHLDWQASSKSASQHSRNAFGTTSVKRERVWAYRKGILIDRRQARAHLSTTQRHLDKQASSESTSERSNSPRTSLIIFVKGSNSALNFSNVFFRIKRISTSMTNVLLAHVLFFHISLLEKAISLLEKAMLKYNSTD